MPRPKSITAPRNRKNGNSAGTATVVKAVAAKRTRRSPYELVQVLKDQRDKIRESMESKLARLDERIQTLESKHESKIKIQELIANKTPDQLEQELQAIKAQQMLLRKALKQGNK